MLSRYRHSCCSTPNERRWRGHKRFASQGNMIQTCERRMFKMMELPTSVMPPTDRTHATHGGIWSRANGVPKPPPPPPPPRPPPPPPPPPTKTHKSCELPERFFDCGGAYTVSFPSAAMLAANSPRRHRTPGSAMRSSISPGAGCKAKYSSISLEQSAAATRFSLVGPVMRHAGLLQSAGKMHVEGL